MNKREIKFRAWDDELKKMVYEFDDESNTYADVYVLGYSNDNGVYAGITPSKTQDWYELEVMQYTGLKDKNGKEIYEGDIVVFDVSAGREGIEPEHNNQRGEVSISGGVVTFGAWTCLYCNNKRLIGNIHANPERLTAPL